MADCLVLRKYYVNGGWGSAAALKGEALNRDTEVCADGPATVNAFESRLKPLPKATFHKKSSPIKDERTLYLLMRTLIVYRRRRDTKPNAPRPSSANEDGSGTTAWPVRAMLSIPPLELELRAAPEKLKTKRPDSPAPSTIPDPVRSMFTSVLPAARPVAEPNTPVTELVVVFSNVDR